MKKSRVEAIQRMADNEVRYRGTVAGWMKLQEQYSVYELTQAEAKLMAHLVQNATVTLPEVPIYFLYDE